MRTDRRLLAAPVRGQGPRWRVGVVRNAGQTARLAAGEVIDHLRATGCMATEIDARRTDPFVDHRVEWAGRAHSDAYDLIIVVGDPSPAVVALAVLVDAAVVCLPVAVPESLTTAIEVALAANCVDAVPVAQVAVDGHRRFSTGTVAVTPERDTEVHWIEGSARRRARASACSIRPTAGLGGSLELLLPDLAPVSCRLVEIRDDDLTLCVDLDARSRRARHVVVEGLAQTLRVVRIEGTP